MGVYLQQRLREDAAQLSLCPYGVEDSSPPLLGVAPPHVAEGMKEGRVKENPCLDGTAGALIAVVERRGGSNIEGEVVLGQEHIDEWVAVLNPWGSPASLVPVHEHDGSIGTPTRVGVVDLAVNQRAGGRCLSPSSRARSSRKRLSYGRPATRLASSSTTPSRWTVKCDG